MRARERHRSDWNQDLPTLQADRQDAPTLPPTLTRGPSLGPGPHPTSELRLPRSGLKVRPSRSPVEGLLGGMVRKSSLLLFLNRQASQGLGQAWVGAGSFQGHAAGRGETEATSEGEKQAVASPAPSTHIDVVSHPSGHRPSPPARLDPWDPESLASDSAGITPDRSQCPSAQTRNHP